MQLPKGDYGYYLDFTVKDSGGTAYNLTGYTIKLKVWAPGAPGTLLTDGACTIVVAASGTCRYAVTSADFTATGKYMAELELTKAQTVESTVPFVIEVEESG